jgi:uroporphyrinogen-III synthase
LSMISSENRFTLFRIMLYRTKARPKAGLDDLMMAAYSAAWAFTSAETWRMALASSSAGWAPETAYFCAKT